MRLSLRNALAACVLLALLVSGGVHAALVEAIEYYNIGLDHYFVTADPTEIAKLDGGVFSGWQRTGEHFAVSDTAMAIAGSTPVCRFYGSPQAGLDSHFYSASPAECQAVQQKFAGVWLLESDAVFYVLLADPVTGACPAGSVPIYRSWNGRTDSNHRYTTSAATQSSMLARGYIAEGYGPGPMPVAMCSPSAATPAAVPQCALVASNNTPVIGTTISLIASCSNGPASYVWSGCASTTATCLASSSQPGALTYSVTASNAGGSGPPASVTVGWHAASAPLPAPACQLSVTTQGAVPTVGDTAVLTGMCTNLPQGYTWSGCNGGGMNCSVSETMPGLHTYSLVARNGSGNSSPVSVSLDWAASAQPAPGFCGSYPAALFSTLPWTDAILYSVTYPDPGFTWDGVWVGSIAVPASGAATGIGRVAVAEYAGGPTLRDVTISRVPCDFRPVDATGVNGPVFHSNGIDANALFTVGPQGTPYPVLQPGQTYYVTIRNAAPDGSASCPASTGHCGALLNLKIPR